MAGDTNPNPEPPAPEIERRLAAVERSAADLNNRVFDAHKWFVTVLFSFVAIILTVFGVLSKIDVRDSTKEMESKVEKALKQAENKVDALVGEALKKPSIEILNNGVPLENQVVDVLGRENISPHIVILNTLFLKNYGGKRTEPLSICISVGAPLGMAHDDRLYWEEGPCSEKQYNVCFYSARDMTIAAGDTLNLRPLLLVWSADHHSNVTCRIKVFYGGERSAEAGFQLKPNWR